MDNPAIRDSIGFQLIHASKNHRNYFTAKLDEIGLQGGDELVIAQLAETNGISQSELANALFVEPPTITKIVQRLEKNDLVERRQNPDDARSQQVILTDCGADLINPIQECWEEGEEVMLQGFSTEERLLLRRMLIQIRENIGMQVEDD